MNIYLKIDEDSFSVEEVQVESMNKRMRRMTGSMTDISILQKATHQLNISSAFLLLFLFTSYLLPIASLPPTSLPLCLLASLPLASYLLPSYLLPATCYLLPLTSYLSPATCYLLPATCYLLPPTSYLYCRGFLVYSFNMLDQPDYGISAEFEYLISRIVIWILLSSGFLFIIKQYL